MIQVLERERVTTPFAPPITKNLIHFFGLRRTGNHAVINWILKNTFDEETNTIHHNDVYGYLRTPPKIKDPQEIAVEPQRNTAMLLSYEDVPLPWVSDLPTVAGEDLILKDAGVTKVLILRDPYNLFASRLQRQRNLQTENHIDPITDLPWDKVIELWKSYAKEYVGQTNYLGEKVVLNYNLWFQSKTYRNVMMREYFGAENKDLGIEEIPSFGGGSSFKPLDYSGNGKELGVLDRWQEFRTDPQYLSFFKDPELLALSKRIFGDEALLER